MPTKTQMKRYNLAVPTDMFDQLEELAEKRGTTVVELLRRFITLGLIVVQTQADGGEFLIREGDSERQIILV
jgi:hypothetical protein